MKRIKVGNNDKADEQFNKDIKLKIDSFKILVEYISLFNENVEVEELYKRPFLYAIELTTSNHKPDFKKVIIEKVFELIGFSVSKLQELCTPFERVEYDFNPVTFEYEKPDNAYYIESEEQLKRYEAVKNICEAVKQISDMPIHYGSLIQALRHTAIPDYKTQTIQPNLAYVLNGAKAIMPR